MDISQIRQAALNSLYAHKDHLPAAHPAAHPADDEVQVVDVKQYHPSPQPTIPQGMLLPTHNVPHPTAQGMSLPTPPAMPPLARQNPSPYPRQHAPPPPDVSKPTFLGLLGGHPVYQSIFDLRRLGLRFDEILQQSGCSEEFLRHIFKQLGYSIETVVQPPKPAPAAVAQVQAAQTHSHTQSQSPRTQPVMTFEQFRKTRSEMNTPAPRTPPVGAAPFPAVPIASIRSIPRFGEKSRRQKRLCIEISDSESDSEVDGVVAKRHKDMSLEETRLEIARIQALIAQQSASSRNGTPSHEDSEVSETTSEAAASVEKSPVDDEAVANLEPVVQIAAAAPRSQKASPASPPLAQQISTPSISPEVQAYLNSKNIALESLSAVQLDKIVQIVKIKTLLKGEEDAFTTSLMSATQPHKIPQPDIPPPATRQPNQSDTQGIDARGRAPVSHQPQQQDQTAHVVSMANTDYQIGVTNELSELSTAWRGRGKCTRAEAEGQGSCSRLVFSLVQSIGMEHRTLSFFDSHMFSLLSRQARRCFSILPALIVHFISY